MTTESDLPHFVLRSFHCMFDFQFLTVQNRSYEDHPLILLLTLIAIHVFSIDFSNEYFHGVSKMIKQMTSVNRITKFEIQSYFN